MSLNDALFGGLLITFIVFAIVNYVMFERALRDWRSQRDEIEKLREDLAHELDRRQHWQGLAYTGMQLVDYILEKNIRRGEGTTEDVFERDCVAAKTRVEQLRARGTP